MASIATHPAVAIARGALRASGRPRLSPLRARGRLGAPFEPFARETIIDPASAYRRLHARPGVHPAGRNVFALASYRDVRAAARAHDVLVSGEGVTLVRAPLPMMLTLDRPRHDVLRRLVAPLFTASRSAAMEQGMRELVSSALDRMLAEPGADAVSELAIPLPITVIARMLGVPETDVERLHRWSDGVVEGFHAGSSLRSAASGLRSASAAIALHRYMLGVFARLREHQGDDVISALLASRDGGALTDEELFWFSLMLLVAGNETTTNLIGSLLLALARDPVAYERLRAEPELIGPAVEEGVRWSSPIQRMYRTATVDYTVDATTIPAGARVLLLFGAATRDPNEYPDPDRFIVDRDPTDHLGFGTGIHFCLGAHLARVETRVVLEQLLQRVSRISLAGEVRFTHNPTVHGPSHLPLRLVPSSG
jgi:cytochrome P450